MGGLLRPRTSALRILALACICSGSHLGCGRERHLAARNGTSGRGIDGESRAWIRQARCLALGQAGRPPLP